MSDKPKLTQILYSGLGGHGSVVLSLITADIEKKFDHNLIFYGIEDLLPEYEKFCIENNVQYALVKKRKGWDVFSWFKVYHELVKNKANKILLHSTSLIPVLICYKILRRSKLVQVEHQSPHLKRKSEKLWSLLGMLFAKNVVLLTKEYVPLMQNQLGLFFKKRKVKIIPNGIDLKKFKSSKDLLPSDKFTVSMIARFTSGKDQLTLIKAVKILSNSYKNLTLKLAGTGATFNDLKSKYHSDNIIFLGLLEEHEIIGLLIETDFYVHSTKGETMSTSIMQAMAMSKTVIASDVSGVNNMITHGENGYLFNFSNEDQLVEILEKLINGQFKSTAENARKHAEHYFSDKNMFNKYKGLIENLNI